MKIARWAWIVFVAFFIGLVLVVRYRQKSVNDVFEQARQEEIHGDWNGALRGFTEVIELNPTCQRRLPIGRLRNAG